MGDLIQFPRRPVVEPFLPVRLVARNLDVSPRTIQRWVADGMDSTFANGKRRVRMSDALARRDSLKREA